jgi:hypothetical protein
MFKKLFSFAFFLSFSLHSHSLFETIKEKLGITRVEEEIKKDTSNKPKKVCKICQPGEDDTVSFQDKKALRDKLQQAGFRHFDEKTDIAGRLSSHRLVPAGVIYCLELALYDYNENLKQPEPTEEVLRNAQKIMLIMHMRKPQLLKLILDGCPEAFEELKKKSVYHEWGWFEDEEDNARG